MEFNKSDTEGSLMDLSTRENVVLALVASGCSYKEVAVRLKISTRTVHTYMERCLLKLRANSRSQAIAIYAAQNPKYRIK